MSVWRAAKARRVLAALFRLGWSLKKQVGSHRRLVRPGWPGFTFCFHDSLFS
jgi:predicted RNA binding protein YcfA (HicA-like mRNA interferase family)